MTSRGSFEELIREAERQPFSGWDFSWLQGRWQEQPLPWDYSAMVRRRLLESDSLLDMGTGGGEFLSSLAPLPPRAVATEAYPPNVEIARARLAPLGVEVVAVEGAPGNVDIHPGEGLNTLPFLDGSFSLVINRHESYHPAEVRRVLRPGGTFLTQQVGGRHDQDLNRLLGAPAARSPNGWTFDFFVDQVRSEGFEIMEAQEAFPETYFADIGAVVYYLKAVIWQIPDFTVGRYRDRLLVLHERMKREGGLRIRGHFFYLSAVTVRTFPPA